MKFKNRTDMYKYMQSKETNDTADQAELAIGIRSDQPYQDEHEAKLQDIPKETSEAIVAALLAGDRQVLPEGLGAQTGLDTTDGARLSFDTGRILHIRPSGNAPELRCYVEAESESVAQALLSDALDRLRRAAV